MKTFKDFTDYRELDQKELTGISGGVIWFIIGGIIVAMAKEVISDWDNFKAGLSGQGEMKSW
jgi:hypothetical protein